MWYLFCCLEVLIWSLGWKLCLETLNRYVIFILLLCEYLIETFFVLKYVAWYFYMWYTELVCLFEYWVCILCLSYFTELVVSIADFVFLLYWWFLYACVLLFGNAERNIEMYIGIFSLNLFVTHDIFVVYFFVIRILFCVIDRISVCLLSNWVLYLYSCPLCFVFKLCVWYWKVQTWYLLLCWLRLYTNLCNWVAKGYLFCLCLCHEGLFYFVTFLSQNFLFLFSGGEFVAVRSFWVFWKMGCLVFCRNFVFSKSWTILFCHKSIFWAW